MVKNSLQEVLEGISLKGERIPETLARPLMPGYAPCDCGACDGGGYCICEDSITSIPSLSYSERKVIAA